MQTLVIGDQNSRPIRTLSLHGMEKLTIGRSPERDLVVDDPGVSRLHCVLYLEDGEWCIADAGSKSGTYVDDARVKWKRLKPGRVASIGELRLWIEGEPDLLASPQSDAGAADTEYGHALQLDGGDPLAPSVGNGDPSERTSAFLSSDEGDHLRLVSEDEA